MAQGENSRHDVLMADEVQHVEVEALVLAEAHHCVVGEERGAECDVVDLDVELCPKGQHQLNGSYRGNCSAKRMSTEDDCLTVLFVCTVHEVFQRKDFSSSFKAGMKCTSWYVVSVNQLDISVSHRVLPSLCSFEGCI